MGKSKGVSDVDPPLKNQGKGDDGSREFLHKRSSITMLVLGDEGVGKSSLISTFVSRHFSEIVPGIMTRVRLPPDPENSCITTIVDSQGGDAALISAVASMSTTPATSTTTAPSNVITNFGSPNTESGSGNSTLSGTVDRGGGAVENSPTLNSPSSSSAAFAHSSPGSTSYLGPSTDKSQNLPVNPFLTSNRLSTKNGIENVDSIILIYDLDRDETFFRLENHWLPLIERCYNGSLPVIVAGNKMDLFLPSSAAGVTDEQVLARSRQQIVSLMQRFRFVRQCIKCSAKNLLRVDEVFLKAQQAVLYPFTPLYDLDMGRLSENCRRAFTRIFRMYDRDHDGLLSHSELDRFQYETFHVPVYERDLTGWKKVVSRNNPDEEVVRDGKFTVAGFLAIFDVFICQNRLDVPWQALRSFGYDDSLNLHIPQAVYKCLDNSSWALTTSERKFISDLFHQFDSDHDGVLSIEDLDMIFSIIPEPSLPPWHPTRSRKLFERAFSLPKMPHADNLPKSESTGSASSHFGQHSLSASGITIISNESFPSVDISSLDRETLITKPLSFLEWMGLWHAISAICPSSTRAELFRLGHFEDKLKTSKSRRKKKYVTQINENTPDSFLPSRELRILLLGSPGSGKTAFVDHLCGRSTSKETFSKTKTPETSVTFIRMNRRTSKSKKGDLYESVAVHLIITEVPEFEAECRVQQEKNLSEIISNGGCDLVALAFDSTNGASFAYARQLENSLLTDDISRLYVATKSDQSCISHDRVHLDINKGSNCMVVDKATLHCRALDLEPPLVTSAHRDSRMTFSGEQEMDNRSKVLNHLARCCINEPGFDCLRSKPHEEQKRREASKRRNRKMMWFGVGVGVAVAVVGYLWTGGASSGKGPTRSSGRLGWFRNLFARTESI